MTKIFMIFFLNRAKTNYHVNGINEVPVQASNQKRGESHLLFPEHKHTRVLYQAMLLSLQQPQLHIKEKYP